MAKRTTSKPQIPAAVAAPGITSQTTPETEAVTGALAPKGDPTPPAQGNEGQADTAGEGQPSLATPAIIEAAALARLPKPVPSFVITGPKAGRRRAGRKFGAEPVTILAQDLSEDEITELTSDIALKVERVDAPY